MATYWGQLVNFLGASRKPMLKPFGLFSPLDSVEFLASVDAVPEALTLTPTPDGVTTLFVGSFSNGGTVTASMQLFRNGVLQKLGVQYSIPSRTQIQFIAPFVPQADDYFQVIDNSGSTSTISNQATAVSAGLSPTPNSVLLVFTITLPGVTLINPNAVITRNGLILKPGSDFTLSGSTITFAVAPDASDYILVIS